MKFLVIRLDAIGDVVMTTPVLRCIRKQVAGAEMHFLTTIPYQIILHSNPNVDHIHVWRDDDFTIQQIRNINPDVVIDLQGNSFSERIASLFQVNVYRVKEPGFRRWIHTSLKLNVSDGLHQVDRFFEAVEPLGIRNDGEGMDHFIPPDEKVSESDIPASHLLGYIALVIGGSKFNKKMPVEKLKEICNAINHPLMLIGGKEDFDAAYQVSLIDPIKIYNACGKFSLHESADLLQRARLVMGHDTGLMHMAAALRKPVISIWGSTVPSLGMYPYKGSYKKAGFLSEHVQVKNLWCRPCSVRGLDRCPQGHFKCMKKIPVLELVMKVNSMLKQTQNSNSLTEGW